MQTTGLSQLLLTPFQVHVARLAVLTSLIAPFGGLFASGVKRALGLKVRVLFSPMRLRERSDRMP